MKNINSWKISTFVFGGVAAALIGYHFVPEAKAEEAVPLGACGDQGHMKSALGYLNQAKEQLEAATPDKGGGRVAGIAQTNAAIADIVRGCKFSNEH